MPLPSWGLAMFWDFNMPFSWSSAFYAAGPQMDDQGQC